MLSYISQPPSEVTSLDENEVQSRLETLSFEHAFSRLAGPIQQYLMTPLFFASIGFAIVSLNLIWRLLISMFTILIQPFVALWDPKVLWRGMLYSLAILCTFIGALLYFSCIGGNMFALFATGIMQYVQNYAV